MTPQKVKRRSRPNQNNTSQPSSGAGGPQTGYSNYALRTNEDLNLSVLRWYVPTVTAILSISPYVVLYEFSPESQTWEKGEIEGPLFICALAPGDRGEERYAVVIMNRKALENFVGTLENPEEIEFQDGFIILRQELLNEQGEPGLKVYGLWVHSADMQSDEVQAPIVDVDEANKKKINYMMMLECAKRAAASRPAQSESDAESDHMTLPGGTSEVELAQGWLQQAEPMGRQLSLRELFNKQREEDSSVGIHNHHAVQHSPLIPRHEAVARPQRSPLREASQAQRVMNPSPHILAPTAIHTYSTTAAVHAAAAQFSTAPQQPPGMQPQAQHLLSLFQSKPASRPANPEQGQQPAPVSQSSTPMFQSNPDTDFFRAPPRHTPHQPQRQPQPAKAPSQPPNGMHPPMPGFGPGLSVDELFRQARKAA